ncbi:MAG: hypothetical protein A2Z72_04470 [Omnitrophica bacterium RBG_13_46_9]|nr:MAG: hypothetical protein A2Z72_04470 [Omnitrophica bacterium RBG_13_46_9]
MGIFLLTLIFIFLTIFIESMGLILQLKGTKLTKWFGRYAVNALMMLTVLFWMITSCLIVILQCEEHPRFHNSAILKYIGFILLVSGIILSLWSIKVLGLKRSLGIDLLEENVPLDKKSLYKYIRNPENNGFLITLVGLAVSTGSFYNLIVAAEFVIVMIPHMMLENKILTKIAKNT